MKNNKRPLAVDRLDLNSTARWHYLTGFRGWIKDWINHPFYDECQLFIKKQNQINDDNN